MKHKFIFLVFLLLLFTSHFAFAEEITEPTLIWEIKEGEITKNSFSEVKVEGEEFPFPYTQFGNSAYFFDGDGNVKHTVEVECPVDETRLLVSHNGKFYLELESGSLESNFQISNATYCKSDGTVLWQKYLIPDQISPTGERLVLPPYLLFNYGTGDGAFKIWDENGDIIYKDYFLYIINAIFSLDGEYLLCDKRTGSLEPGTGGLMLYNKNGSKLWEKTLDIYTVSFTTGQLPILYNGVNGIGIAGKYCVIIGVIGGSNPVMSAVQVYTIKGDLLWEQTFEGRGDRFINFTPNGEYLFTYVRNKIYKNEYEKPIVSLYKSENGDLLWSKILDISLGATSISSANNGKFVISGNYHKELFTYLFDENGELIKEFKNPYVKNNAGAQLSQDGKYLFVNNGIKGKSVYFLP